MRLQKVGLQQRDWQWCRAMELANSSVELSEEDQQLKSDLEMLVQRLEVCLTSLAF